MGDGFFPDYREDDYENTEENNENDVLVSSGNGDTSFEWSEQELEEVSKENSANQKNEEEFQEVMSNASRKLDSYWDRDNVVVKIIMYCLFGFAGLGVLYYLFLWFFTN